jgi:hypothetical protein
MRKSSPGLGALTPPLREKQERSVKPLLSMQSSGLEVRL